MDWFERLTGFRETDYADTRGKLRVEGRQLQSLINEKSYGIGELEQVSLRALRERVKSAGGLPGRLKVSVESGDVRYMHRLPENAGALFQVASQFNLLEMIGPEVTPENGVTIYQYDHTQGPACAIAAGAATIYRNYFAQVGESRTAIFGMAVARKKPPMPPVTSTRLLVLHAARIRSAHGTVRLPCPAFVFAFLQEKPQHCDFNHTKELPPNPNLHGSEIGITAKTGKFETYKRALLLVAFVTLG